MNKSFYCRSYDNSDKRLSRNLVIAVRFKKITNESRTVVIPKKIRHEFGIRCPGSVLAIDVHYARVQSPDVWRQMSNDRMSKVPVSTDRIPIMLVILGRCIMTCVYDIISCRFDTARLMRQWRSTYYMFKGKTTVSEDTTKAQAQWRRERHKDASPDSPCQTCLWH